MSACPECGRRGDCIHRMRERIRAVGAELDAMYAVVDEARQVEHLEGCEKLRASIEALDAATFAREHAE